MTVDGVSNVYRGSLPNLIQGQNITISGGGGAIDLPPSPLTRGGCSGFCTDVVISRPTTLVPIATGWITRTEAPDVVAVQRQINGAFAHQPKLNARANASSAAAMANLEPAAGGEVTPEMIANAYLAEKGLLAQ